LSSDEYLAQAVAALREVVLAGEHYRLKAAAHLGLSVSESQAVSYLLARGPMGQTDLASALGFNTSSTTALVDRLERRGIAERRPDPHDRRRSTVRLSKKGLRAVADVTTWIAEAFRTIETAELAGLTSNLSAIAEALRALA
jgi:DNA-binding MarR family transcriptional regulator